MLGPPTEGSFQTELHARGLELAVREAEERAGEVERILSSRKVRRLAAVDERVRGARLALLEELSFTDYPRPSLLVAARQLGAASATSGRHARRRPWRRVQSALVAATLVVVAVLLVVRGALHGIVDRPPLLALIVLALLTAVVARVRGRRPGLSGTPGRRRGRPELEDALSLVADVCRR